MESAARDIVDYILAHQIIPQSFIEELGQDLSRFKSAHEVTDVLVRRGGMTEYQQLHLLTGQGEKLVFGPYRLVKPLGEGGMGKVVKAWQPRLNRFVALKFIHPEYLESKSNALSRFQREALSIAQLQHANIVVLHDAGEIDGVPFIAMEFIDGMSLADMVSRSGPLGFRQACEYMRQAALGLQHSFECGLVHRDIKPSNIVVCQPRPRESSASLKRPSLVTVHDIKRMSDNIVSWGLDRIKILDMGLTRASDSLPSGIGGLTPLTANGVIIGTPEYLAPEQATDSRLVDIRTDLYSLGCTFYFILSGQPPFPHGTIMEKVVKHQFVKPEPLESLRRDVPESVSRIVAKLLAKKPEERFQTPMELAEELSKYLSEVPPASEQPQLASTASETRPFIQVDPGQSSATKPAEMPAPSSHIANEKFPDDVRGVAKMAGSRDSASPRPLDREAAGSTPPGFAEKRRIPAIAMLEGHVGAVSGVAITPDGKLAVTGDVSGKIRVWDLHDSEPCEIGGLHRNAEIQAIALSPGDPKYTVFGEVRQGKAALVRWDWLSNSLVDWGDFPTLDQSGFGCLCFTSDSEMLTAGIGSLAITWKISKGTAAKCKIHKGMNKLIRSLAISPDRQLLAAAGSDKSLHFWDLGRGKWDRNDSVRVNSQTATITTMQFSPDGSVLAMAGLDTEIVLWGMAGASDDSVRVLRGHSSNLLHIQFIADGSQLVSVGMDGQILIWDVRNKSIIREFRLDLTMAYRVAMSADASRLIAGFANGNVGIYSLPVDRELSSESRQSISAHNPETSRIR